MSQLPWSTHPQSKPRLSRTKKILIGVSVTITLSFIGLNLWARHFVATEEIALFQARMQLHRLDKLHHWCGKDPTEEAYDINSERIRVYQERLKYCLWVQSWIGDRSRDPEKHSLWYDNWALIEMKHHMGENFSELEQRGFARRTADPVPIFTRKPIRSADIVKTQ